MPGRLRPPRLRVDAAHGFADLPGLRSADRYDTRFFVDPAYEHTEERNNHLVHARCLYGRIA